MADIDGCITPSIGAPFDLEKVAILKRMISDAAAGITFCTGRPKPYAESILQLFGSDLPVIAESGAIIFNPKNYEIIFTDPTVVRDIHEIETIVQNEVIGDLPAFVEPGKNATVGIIPESFEDNDTIQEMMRRLEANEGKFPRAVNYTVASQVVCITTEGISKGAGLKRLLSILDIDAKDVLAIGDAPLDLDFMKLAGFSACPSNADDKVKKIVDYISPLSDINGMVDIAGYFFS